MRLTKDIEQERAAIKITDCDADRVKSQGMWKSSRRNGYYFECTLLESDWVGSLEERRRMGLRVSFGQPELALL